MGVPEMYIGMFIMWAVALSQSAMDVADDTLGKFLGRKPTGIHQYIDLVYRQK